MMKPGDIWGACPKRYVGWAMEVAEKIVRVMIQEHDESEHGVSWRTVSLKVVPQEDRYKIGTMIDWVYRVRDSY